MPQSSFSVVSSNRHIHTASAFAKTNLIYLQEIGELQAKKEHKSKRENLSSYLFFMVESGSGTLMYNNEIFELSAGSCVFIDCRKPYYHNSSKDLWKLKWIHFDGEALMGIYDKYLERGGSPVFTPASLSAFQSNWERLFTIAKSDDFLLDMRINEALATLLTLLMENSWQPDNQKTDSKRANIAVIRAYLDEHFKEHISLDDLASSFFINKFYLTRIFKQEIGLSINNYLLQKRITHAKQLLRFSDMSIEEIGHSCGIGALYYFSRTFKKIEGISPSEYRKRW